MHCVPQICSTFGLRDTGRSILAQHLNETARVDIMGSFREMIAPTINVFSNNIEEINLGKERANANRCNGPGF